MTAKKREVLWTGVSNRDMVLSMPDQPDINKRVLSVRISREFYRRLQLEAKRRRMGFNEYVRHIIYEATENVELKVEDYEIIERERRRHVERTSAKRRLPKS